MKDRTFRAAVVQAAPVLDGQPLDVEATLTLVERWTQAAKDLRADVVVFPEAFLGGYPKGEDFGVRLGSRSEDGRRAYEVYASRAIQVPGPSTERLGAIARAHGVELVVGAIEAHGSTLYCTALFIGANGELRGRHRKLVPTAMERCIWGRGDGSTLSVVDTPHGKIGAAICWENYMPLLRTSLYQRGVELYAAPTVDDREVWQATMRHIAVEGRCFVLSACQYLPPTGDDAATGIRGGSVIVDPFGTVLAGPAYGEETVLVAEIDPGALTRGRFDLDVVGHYARPDVFELRVDETPRLDGDH